MHRSCDLAFYFVLVVFGIHDHIQGVGKIGIRHILLVEYDDFKFLVSLADRFLLQRSTNSSLHLDDSGVKAGFVVFTFQADHRVGVDHDNVVNADLDMELRAAH